MTLKRAGESVIGNEIIYTFSKCFLLTKYLVATKEKIGKFTADKTSRPYFNQMITINIIRTKVHGNCIPPERTELRIQHHGS